MEKPLTFKNPFRPGAGQLPPYLAGRHEEIAYFEKNMLEQSPILSNLLISGLRGVGKTVLLDTLKPLALNAGWICAGTDMSESVSVGETRLAIRILTDLASAVSNIIITEREQRAIGFKAQSHTVQQYLDYEILEHVYNNTRGLEADKLKAVLSFTWESCKHHAKGIVIAYDEAQNLKDNSDQKEYPLSVLLEIIQYVQRKEMPYLLILTGLPTLMSNLIESRTYAERMFHQMTLRRLTKEECREAIVKPIQDDKCPVDLVDAAIDKIIDLSGGYPYFIQYICKEVFDAAIQQLAMGVSVENTTVQFNDIIRKLDADFYQGRWQRATDKQRNLLMVISQLENAEGEFSLKDIETGMRENGASSSNSAINLMLKSLTDAGLIYKTRHGVYAFAVPLFSHFVKREWK